MKIRLLLIGSFWGLNNDEGLTQISKSIYEYFSRKFETKYFDTKSLYKIETINKIYSFNPQIIHYITGPTIRSLLILKFFRILLKNSKIVVSITRGFLPKKYWGIIKYLKPDLVLSQAEKWDLLFKKNDIKTEFVPNAIDLQKFKKLNIDKKQLREKYNLPKHKKLFLHVGHLRKNRNIDFLIELQNKTKHKNYQVVIVASTYFESKQNIKNNLIKNGCIVIDRYIDNIVEIYNACDFYVFPVKGLNREYYPDNYNDVGVIDMPLSILEALACELPVITAKIDAIQKLIKNEMNELPLIFYDGSLESFMKALTRLEKLPLTFDFNLIKNKFSKKNVLENIEKNYYKLLDYNG